MDTHVFLSGAKSHLLGLLFLLLFGQSRGQSCDCPSINECGPCQGVLTSLSLQYTGSLTELSVNISDNGGTIFTGIINPGDIIALTSSNNSGNPFVGNVITINESSVGITVISTACNTPIFKGSVFGNYLVVTGKSLNDKALCCQTQETIPPVIDNCPDNLSLISGPGECGKTVTWIPPTSTDNCNEVELSSNHNPNDFFPIGTTVVTYEATDRYGNTSKCEFTVTIIDETPPVIFDCPTDFSVKINSSCNGIGEWLTPSASDDCELASLTSSHISGSSFPLGVTEITYTAEDIHGNTSSCSFYLTVYSDETPVVDKCPEDIITKADETGEAVISWEAPTATSSCGQIELIVSKEPGTVFKLGRTVVTYTLPGEDGGKTVCSFTVSVEPEELTVTQFITPDGDLQNDEWVIVNIEKYLTNKILIVDRWGNTIYQATGYNNDTIAWRGNNMNGHKVPSGTYFYHIEVILNGQRIEKKGFIEVIQP